MLFFLSALMLPLRADDIVVKEIGGVPVIKTKLRCGNKQIEAHVLIDIGLNAPMVMEEKALGGLGLNAKNVVGKEVEIEFSGGVRWERIPLQSGKLKMLEILTANYAPELKEVPVVAVLGLPGIKGSVIELDLQKGLLRTLGVGSEEARKQEFDYTDTPHGIVLDGIGPTGKPLKALVAMRNEDSTLSSSLLKSARVAGVKPNSLSIAGFSLGEMNAFRFQPVAAVTPAAVDAVLGVSALRNFTITIWPQRKKISLIPHPGVTFPQDEQDYFFALADRKPEGVEAFIGKKPSRRLLDEACLTLWQMQLGNPASSRELLEKRPANHLLEL